MKTFLRLSIFTYALLLCSHLTGQIFWEGTGDGTSWDDAANWSTGTLPGSDDIAEILIDATITGQIEVTPMRIKTGAGANIKFHLDMDLDNEAVGDHALVIGAKCTVEFGEEGTPYTFDFNTAANKHGILNNGSGDSSQIVVMKDATLNFNKHNNAINLIATNSTFENNGTINVSSAATNGIKSGGSFINNGVISINAVGTDGIQIISGSFTNTELGAITTDKCGDDGIEVINEGTLTNQGVINSTAVDDASSGNHALAVGSADTLGYFVNDFTGEINANGGISDAARAISIYEEGSMTNAGKIITTGGNPATSIYSRNIFTNDVNGYIDLGDGRINANIGSLTNSGYIKTTRDGSGIFSTENSTVTNNAFYWYENSGQFAAGEGIIEDNGFSLNNIFRKVIDANGSCTVDIANAPYDWTINNNDYASSMDDGTFTFTPNSVQADSVILKTTLPEVNIKVVNICQEAVIITNTTDTDFSDQINIYPTILTSGSMIQLDTDIDNTVLASIYGLNGRLIKQLSVNGNMQLSTTDWGIGQFIINISDGKKMTSKQIVIID